MKYVISYHFAICSSSLKGYRFGYRFHRGGLDDSLKTRVYITVDEFKSILPKYKFYAFDDRCNQFVFMRKNLSKHIDEPTWLYIELF